MHMFDSRRRFMGGYGIVGGNLPIAAGHRRSPATTGVRDEVTLCTFGDGASNQGTFGETLNLAALWRLPVVFMVTNNQFGMGTSLSRHSAVTDLQRKGESLGVPGMRCDGMDVIDTHAVVGEAVAQGPRGAPPVLVEAITYRFRGHSMADPEQYRTKEEVRAGASATRSPSFGELPDRGGHRSTRTLAREIDEAAIARVDAAVAFAERLTLPRARVALRRRLRARGRRARLVLGRDRRGPREPRERRARRHRAAPMTTDPRAADAGARRRRRRARGGPAAP